MVGDDQHDEREGELQCDHPPRLFGAEHWSACVMYYVWELLWYVFSMLMSVIVKFGMNWTTGSGTNV